MGLVKFQQRFSEVTHDDSTQGMIAGSDQYYECRRRVNDAQARRLPARRQQQVRQIRQALNTLGETAYDFTDISAGGGTMWRVGAAYDTAAREDVLGALIADLSRPASHSAAARRRAELSLAAARVSFKQLAHPNPTETERQPSHSDYARSYATSRVALARLETLVRALPDVPARRMAGAVAHTLAEPLKEAGPDGGTR